MELNFYQSNTWKEINKYVLNKPVFEIEFLGKKYFGIIKEKKTLFVTLKWYQVLGITLGDNWIERVDEIKKELDRIKRDFDKGYGNILFQFGIIDELKTYKYQEINDHNSLNEIYEERQNKEKIIKDKLGLNVSFRENMPLATVYFDLSLGEEKLFSNMSKSARSHIKKAVGRQLYFEFANEDDWELFYDIWHQTSADKDFNIIRKKTFMLLKDYLLEKKAGNLFLAKKNGKIVSGSICLFIDNNIVYLYGATNRNFGNVGGHQFLKYEIFKRGVQNGYKYADLLGVAPAGMSDHHLTGVSQFKNSLGGTNLEYLGNYDLVLDNKLYQTFKLFKTYKTNILMGGIAAKNYISEKTKNIKGEKEIKPSSENPNKKESEDNNTINSSNDKNNTIENTNQNNSNQIVDKIENNNQKTKKSTKSKSTTKNNDSSIKKNKKITN